ncbi:MAG TPA: efflux RND transporter periplasmic adaptor subunit [Thermodesulfobacteriota bacterium]|nr:efflux RND transporter periplasmic adaptor subunit [Thermodesulfobacteriota bacterium]
MKTKKNKSGIRGWRLLSIVILLAGLNFMAACGFGGNPTKEKPPAAETKAKAEQGEIAPGSVTLSVEKQKVAGLQVMPLSYEMVSAPLSATAVIELNADRLSRISTRVTGKITRVLAGQGQRVKAGQPLAYADSTELDQAFSEYLKAKSRQELTEKTLKREEILFEKKVCPEKDVLKARQEYSEAEADLTLSREKFRLMGINISQMEQQKAGGGKNHPLIPIASTIGGVVIERAVTQGEVIGPDKMLFTVADLSTLWLQIDLYEKDLGRIRKGMSVKLSVASLPDKSFKGRISYVGDLLDEKTRMIKARVTVDNSDGLLKPGMFATVEIQTAVGEKKLMIPENAVFIDGSSYYVFLQTAADKFSRKEIKVGKTLDNKVEILDGLKSGDSVVTQGAFALKSELKKETL